MPIGENPRRPAFSKRNIKIILDSLRKGLTFETAAAAAGITPPTLLGWRNEGKAVAPEETNPKKVAKRKFAIDVEIAYENGNRRLEEGMLEEADWRAQQFVMQYRKPRMYGSERFRRETMQMLDERTEAIMVEALKYIDGDNRRLFIDACEGISRTSSQLS